MVYAIILGAILFGVAIYFGTRKTNKNPRAEYINHPPTQVHYFGIEKELLEILNAHRISIGVTKVISEQAFTLQAIEHTDYMILDGRVSHDNFPKRVAYLGLRRFTRISEVVGYGYSSSGGWLNGYLKSPEHKYIIEKNGFNVVGISTKSNSDGRFYNTIIFGKSELKIILLLRLAKKTITKYAKSLKPTENENYTTRKNNPTFSHT